MKTAKEWFNELDEPYKSQAIKNTNKKRLEYRYTSLSHALINSFEFICTEEDKAQKRYWYILYQNLKNSGK